MVKSGVRGFILLGGKKEHFMSDMGFMKEGAKLGGDFVDSSLLDAGLRGRGNYQYSLKMSQNVTG